MIPIYVDQFLHTDSVDVHSHEFFEFVYIDQGFSSHFYNGVTTILTPGDVFGIRPGDVHGYTLPQQTVLYNCLFLPSALANDLEEIHGLPGIGGILSDDNPTIWQRVHLNATERKQTLFYLDTMILERRDRPIGWELRLKALLIEFLLLLTRIYVNQHSSADVKEYQYTKHIYAALDLMDGNIGRSIHIEDIAEKIGLSPDYFSRLFKHFTGLTPVEYIKSMRIAKATELLMDPSIAVSQVAIEVGFDDPSYFARQFKKVLGVTPSQFQKDETR